MSRLFPNLTRHPHVADLCDDSRDTLFAIYLSHPAADKTDMGREAFVEAMANLHMNGFLRIVSDWRDGEEVFRFEVVPFSETLQ